MRLRAIPAAVALAVSACAPKPVKVAVAPVDFQPRLAEADALVRIGCFDCLLKAFDEYDAVRRAPAAPAPILEAATIGAIRTALLLDLRERELGMLDDGYLERARGLAAGRSDALDPRSILFAFVDAVSWRIPEVETTTDDLMLDRARRLGLNRDQWKEQFRAEIGDRPFGAYLWLAFACASGEALRMSSDELTAPVAPLADAPIVQFKRAICPTINIKALDQLREREPRFLEANYFLGVQSILQGRLDDADAYLRRAYAWHAKWPAVTLSLGNLAMTAEDFEPALAFYDETLDTVPTQRDAMLGRLKALTYLVRHEDAIRAADTILRDKWNRGEAYYWRAWNELQLGRLEEAWTDVEDAWKLWMRSDVAKLAGTIAYRRSQLDTARDKFATAYRMNPNDCEAGYYLGLVHADQRSWAASADALTSAAACMDTAEQRITEEIARIQAWSAAADRKARAIARREQEIRTLRRMRATSWFDTAVAFFNLSRTDEARRFAEKVSDDEEFGARAKSILTQIEKRF